MLFDLKQILIDIKYLQLLELHVAKLKIRQKMALDFYINLSLLKQIQQYFNMLNERLFTKTGRFISQKETLGSKSNASEPKQNTSGPEFKFVRISKACIVHSKQ